MTVSYPATAARYAIPRPIVPVPRTAICRIMSARVYRSGRRSLSRRRQFWTRPFEALSPCLALRFGSGGGGDSNCSDLNPAAERDVNDSPSADPTQALEQRKLVDVANRLPVDGRD